MIIGKIHPGSGIGDQLFSYIITRTIALDKGFEYGFVGKEFFKGKDFMNLDWGKDVDRTFYIEKNGELIMEVPEDKIFTFNKPYYDPEVNFIQDGTIIDGYGAQDERYWGHRLNEIDKWVWARASFFDWEDLANLCVINVRGGEYRTVSELILPKEYWDKAIEEMIRRHPVVKFEVHTDDPEYCKELFGDKYPIVRDIETNWRALRYAKYAIISNSAFAIIPRILNGGETIAPKYWAGRNVEEWRRPQNYYSEFTYL